jgi:hypothetical protein
MWLAPSSMRSAFVPESACLTKESELRSIISALPSEQLPMASGKPLRPASWLLLWKRDSWMQRLCGAAIFDASQQDAFEEAWTQSLRASRARTYQSPAVAPGLVASEAACSSASLTSLTIAVRGASFWRTSEASLLPPPPLWTKKKATSKKEQPPASWENWPTAGGTRNGSLFQRPMWEPLTAGSDGSASPGGAWMTPSVVSATGQEYTRDGGVRGQERLALPGQAMQATGMWLTPHGMGGMDHSGKAGAGGEFAKQASQWGTPQARDYRSPDSPDSPDSPNYQRKLREGYTIDLNSQAANFWPTPRSSDGPKGGPNQAGSKGDLMLPSAAAQWPTPMAADQRGSAGAGKTELPNASMNWPTPAARDYRGGGASDYETGRQEPHGHARLAGGSLFAPGPADARWPAILAERPDLAPATEPGVRLLVDGVALLVDESRNHQLRQVGNGVVPLQAAVAVVVLARRAGIFGMTQPA